MPGAAMQLAAEVQQRDSRWHCRRSRVLSLADGALDIFMCALLLGAEGARQAAQQAACHSPMYQGRHHHEWLAGTSR